MVTVHIFELRYKLCAVWSLDDASTCRSNCNLEFSSQGIYKPAVHFTHGRLVLRLLHIFCVCWFVCASALITCNIYITYIVAMQHYFSQLQTAALSTGVGTMRIV